MLKKKTTAPTEIPDGALNHGEGKYISKFEYVCVMLSRIGGQFGTTLTGTLAAAFLHDVIEDTPATAEDVKERFGDEVLELVSGVTKLDQIVFTSREEEQAENFRKIFVAMAKDIRVIIIKLADRLHNMRSLEYLSHERQQRMAKETLDIYSPLAGRLGISQIKCELDDLCLKYLFTEEYNYLVENIHKMMGEQQKLIDEVVSELKTILAESSIKGDVFGLQKHL
jgi:GTP pyrophosphokinase